MSSLSHWQQLAGEAIDRDPRENRFGYFSGGSFVLDSVRVFAWFPSLSSMQHNILEVEPRNYGVEDVSEIQAYQVRLAPILDRLGSEGLTPQLLEAVRAVIGDLYSIEWWGTFDDIASGKDEFAREVLDGFLDDDAPQSVREEDMNDFVEYLETYGI